MNERELLSVAAQRIARWREDPCRMVVEEFGATPDAWQANALRLFARGKQRLAMKACKGPGKSTVLAWIIWNFLACYGDQGEHPKGAAISITADNLSDNLWAELAKWQGRSEFLKAAFVWTKTRVFAKDHPETWFFSARSWPKSGDAQAQANALAGLHAKFILFVLDESGGIPEAVAATAEAILANEGGFAKIVQAGNPTHLEGPLYRACTTERHLWDVIEITGDPDAADRSPRISPQWAREQIEKYGRDNPWVLVNVFGRFPPSSLNTLLGPDDVEAAKKRYGALETHAYLWAQKRIGVDVARFGDDRTVIFPRQGIAAFMPEQLRQRDTVQIAGRVAWWINEWAREDANTDVHTFVDDSGHWGHGVIDNLRAGAYRALPVLFEDKNTADPRHYNRRAEMWISMAEWVKTVGALPPDLPAEMTAELTVPQYTFKDGKFLIEPKDIIKERLGRSPDLADALALTFALPDMPAELGQKRPRGTRGESRHDWNPLEEVAA
jgi:hypothetical protein